MDIDSMIAVLEAAKNGEKIECKHKVSDYWEHAITPHWDFMTKDYRIAPKQMTLIEELRAWPVRELAQRAADRIEELEKALPVLWKDITTDELLAELKRRTT